MQRTSLFHHLRHCPIRPCPRLHASSPFAAARQLSNSTNLNYPRKDSQDRESINTEPSEYSKSGTDNASAEKTADAAFDPSITDPGKQKDKASHESGGPSENPLEVSPANKEISEPREGTEGGAESSSKSSETGSARERTSGGGSP
ncbi:MAG: hypothetical protein Q9190_004146 [Brigantiaea leucoxantha]